MPKKYPGIFISFEGTEGSGKSTLIQHLKTALSHLQFEVISTREPGGNPVSEKIRETVLHFDMNPWTELLLYEAARSENLSQLVVPALMKGQIVLCDRFTDSSLAYQGYARGLPWDKVRTLNSLATQGLKPDLTVFLDIDPETGLKRANDPNRFETEGVAFQEKVRRGFLKARRENPRSWLTLNVQGQSPEQLTETVLQEIVRRFKPGKKSK